VPTLELAPEASSPSDARRFLRRVLRGWAVDEKTTEDIALVVTELVTNAIIHARASRIVVDVSRGTGGIETSVTDDGAGSVRLARPEPTSVTGRGIHILDQLFPGWEMETSEVEGHKTIRFEVAASRLPGEGSMR
jgi:anti-sigma regulatory factor (Ser/Thr protein kinase)